MAPYSLKFDISQAFSVSFNTTTLWITAKRMEWVINIHLENNDTSEQNNKHTLMMENYNIDVNLAHFHSNNLTIVSGTYPYE